LVERLEIAKQEDDELQSSGKEPARPFSSPFWWAGYSVWGDANTGGKHADSKVKKDGGNAALNFFFSPITRCQLPSLLDYCRAAQRSNSINRAVDVYLNRAIRVHLIPFSYCGTVMYKKTVVLCKYRTWKCCG
jgi:hypothetical protein